MHTNKSKPINASHAITYMHNETTSPIASVVCTVAPSPHCVVLISPDTDHITSPAACKPRPAPTFFTVLRARRILRQDLKFYNSGVYSAVSQNDNFPVVKNAPDEPVMQRNASHDKIAHDTDIV
jgi:hypothetical protein